MTALAGYTITTASSWLGGALAYRYRLGADHSDPRVGPRRYTSVADLLDLPEGEPCGVEVDGLPVVLLRAGDVVHAVGGNCPHLGAPLAQGWTYRGSLVCPWHGSRFDPATGDVVQGPATHPLPCFDVRTDGGPRRAAPPGALALAHRIDDAQGGQPVKADEVLVEHHRVLLGLLDRLERTPDPVLRRQLLDAFVVELTIHTQIEDEVLYPAVRDVSPLLSVAHAEHRQIDEQLAVVLGTDVGGDELPVEVRMLTRTLAHHVDEEELHMLPQARALGEARLEELGGQLRQRQRELDRSAVAGAIARVKRSVLRRV